MNSTLSVFFNVDKTYLAVFTPGSKGLEMNYINSTEHRIDLENFYDDYETELGTKEFRRMIKPLKKYIGKVNVTIPAEFVLVSQFPGKAGMSNDDLRKLIGLEIRQAFPQFNPDDFGSNLIPMSTSTNSKPMMMAVIIPKSILEACSALLKSLQMPITSVEISQLNAHSALLYNYPELFSETIMVMGLQDQFIDLSVIKEGTPAYYNLVSFNDKEKLGEVFREEHAKLIKSGIASEINHAYFFGTGLNKKMFKIVKSVAEEMEIEVSRLNAFRMISTKLDDREREYCSRVMHIFPPVVGGSFPAYHERIKLY